MMADAHDHHVRAQHFAAGQTYAGHLVLAEDGVNRRAEADIDPLRAMLLLERARQRGTGHAGEHPVERFQQDHLLAELEKHRRGVEPNIAAVDHNDVAGDRQLGHHPVNFGARAHGVDARQVWPSQVSRRGSLPVAQTSLP